MSSPRQRINNLKREIAQLDQQMLIPATSTKNLSIPLQIVSFKRDSQKREMEQKLNSLRVSTSSREHTLAAQLSEIQQKLKLLARKKQNELSNSKKSREEYRKKIEFLKNLLEKTKDNYQITAAELNEKQRIRENSTVAKARVYSESLIPLECDARDLALIKENLIKKQLFLQEESDRYENSALMCKEELSEKINQRAENIAIREELEVNLEYFLREYADEIQYLKDEDEYFKSISNIVQLQHKYKEEEQRLEASLGLNTISAEKLEDKLKNIEKELGSIVTNADDPKGNSELRKLENLISETCEESGIDTFESVILDLNALERFEIDEEILKLQLSEIMSIETQYRTEFEWEEKKFSEMIIIKKYERNSTDEIEEEYRIKKSKYRNILAAINQWKEEVESFIMETGSKTQVQVRDKIIIQEFNASLGKLSSTEMKKRLESLVSSYYLKVFNRDKMIQNYSGQIREKKAEKSRVSEMLQKTKQEIYRLRIDIIRVKQQIHLLFEKEKSLNIEYNRQSTNPIVKHLFILKNQINTYKNRIYSETKAIEILNLSIADYSNRMKAVHREISLMKISQREITEENQAVQYQIEKLYDKKQKNSSDSLTLSRSMEENSINSLKFKIDGTTSELDVWTKELSNFESDYQQKLSVIEQEESMLRSQHQAIESALRNIEIETKRIKEMEYNLIKFEDAEAAPNPETLKDQSRSKSASKFAKIFKNEDFYTAELRDGEEGSCIIEGNSLEVVVKPLSKQVAISTDRGIVAQPRIVNKKYYRFNLEDTSPQEKAFLEKIMPLLEGTELYKKISLKNPMGKHVFDPLDPGRYPPESVGFAFRQFRLHKNLKRIDVKQPMKPGFEATIVVDTLLAPIISPNVMVVLKLQNHLNNDDLDYDKLNEKFNKTTYSDINSEAFKEKCRECSYYPFKICIGQDEKIELIAKGYQTFKYWINGINALIKYKRLIPRIRSRIESYTTV